MLTLILDTRYVGQTSIKYINSKMSYNYNYSTGGEGYLRYKFIKNYYQCKDINISANVSPAVKKAKIIQYIIHFTCQRHKREIKLSMLIN